MTKNRKTKATRKNTEIYELRKENTQLKRDLIDMTNAWRSVKAQLNEIRKDNVSKEIVESVDDLLS
jgi:hypothetical protein